MRSLRFPGRFPACSVTTAVIVFLVFPATPARAQVCAGLPAASAEVLTLTVGSSVDKPPLTDPEYIGVGYARVIGERLTISGVGRLPIADPALEFQRAGVEISAAFPRTIGPGCPVITAGYSVRRGIHEASPHLSAAYGVGWTWDRGEDERWLSLYAAPGVLVDRKQDYSDGELSTRVRFASEVGFVIASSPSFYLGGGLRRAFLDGGGTSLETRIGWRL
jgi:hypothetical protein